MPRADPTEEYLIAEKLPRISDDSLRFSLIVSMANSPNDHFSFGCLPRPHRRSPGSGGASNSGARSGLFSRQGGRTVLPPLNPPFRGSSSPVPDQSFPSNQFPQQDIQGFGQQGWAMNAAQQQSSGFSMDPRYSTPHSQYSSYPSRTSSAMPSDIHDSRTLPPLNAQMQGHPGVHNPSMMSGGNIRSPTAGYPASYMPYQEQPHQGAAFYPPPDARSLPPPVQPMGYDQTGMIPRRPSMSVDRTVPSRLSVHGTSPYTRNPPMASPSNYNAEPVPEPSIKKKRKRADAEQLKVLNETYNRTAFPSTEERNELAKKLNMSARSVQIWFQNKRQAMRQSTRQASTAAPPTTNEPYPTASHAPVSISHPGPYGSHPPSPANVGQAYGVRPGVPSPTPSLHHRVRGHEDETQDPRRFSGRHY